MENDEAQIVEQLLCGDDSFKRLHDKHQRLKDEIDKAVRGHASLPDEVIGRLKREKLKAKDLMAAKVADARRVTA